MTLRTKDPFLCGSPRPCYPVSLYSVARGIKWIYNYCSITDCKNVDGMCGRERQDTSVGCIYGKIFFFEHIYSVSTHLMHFLAGDKNSLVLQRILRTSCNMDFVSNEHLSSLKWQIGNTSFWKQKHIITMILFTNIILPTPFLFVSLHYILNLDWHSIYTDTCHFEQWKPKEQRPSYGRFYSL